MAYQLVLTVSRRRFVLGVMMTSHEVHVELIVVVLRFVQITVLKRKEKEKLSLSPI